jgi:hypothetical protein
VDPQDRVRFPAEAFLAEISQETVLSRLKRKIQLADSVSKY